MYEDGAKIRFPEPDQAILINTAGGLTGGDDLMVNRGAGQRCGDDNHSGFGKDLSRDRTDSRQGCNQDCARPGARLHWLPQETILFSRSAVERTFDVELAASSSFLAVEFQSSLVARNGRSDAPRAAARPMAGVA